MKTKDTKLPAVGEFVRHHGTLVRIEKVPPKPQPPPETDFIFEERVAECKIMHKGQVLKELQTLNDFYGLGTGEDSAINEMKARAEEMGLTINSDLEIVVVRVIRHFRAQPTDRENIYDKRFPDFERRRQQDLDEETRTIVWSSKNVT